MAIYQGDIGIHDIKLGSIDVFEIYQGSKLVYPENTEITITFKLNVSGTVTINGYTPRGGCIVSSLISTFNRTSRKF